jgi:hypothetical protein
MQTRERNPPLAEFDLGLLVESIHFPSRMIEEGVPDEIILVSVITADEQQRQGPDRARRVGLIQPVIPFVDESTGLIVPPAQMTAETACCLFGKIDKDSLNANFYRGTVRGQITPTVEVVLVNDRPAKEALRPKYEIERFAYSRFADVVPTDKKRMAGKIDAAMIDASEIHDFEASNSHYFFLQLWICFRQSRARQYP